MRTNVPGGIRVVGLPPDGSRLDAGPLAHGQSPDRLLESHGWSIDSAWAADVLDDRALELTYRVTELSGIRHREEGVLRDADVGPDEVGDPYQRVAAYAIVTSERGLLLTQFTEQTHVAGHWGLPGGGLDAGESPADGVHREVWEETGQRIKLGELVEVQSSHWIGRAPSRVIEDFHAIRIVYRATCPEPSNVIIHDVDGTTADALWVPLDRLGEFSLTRSWDHLAELLPRHP